MIDRLIDDELLQASAGLNARRRSLQAELAKFQDDSQRTSEIQVAIATSLALGSRIAKQSMRTMKETIEEEGRPEHLEAAYEIAVKGASVTEDSRAILLRDVGNFLAQTAKWLG